MELVDSTKRVDNLDEIRYIFFPFHSTVHHSRMVFLANVG